jgi:hypothetical protein
LIPDHGFSGSAEECCRQSRVVAEADAADAELAAFLDGALADLANDSGRGGTSPDGASDAVAAHP